MSSSSSSSTGVVLTAPLYPFESGAYTFPLTKAEDAATLSGDVLNRCWFASIIHALAHDPDIFALTQEAVILLDAMTLDVAMAVVGNQEQYLMGFELAQLVQQSSCPDLVPIHDLDLLQAALPRALRLFGGGSGGSQEFIQFYPLLRGALLLACGALTPHSPLLGRPPPPVMYSDGIQLDLLTTSTPEWIIVERTAPKELVMYDPDRVRVGATAIYEVMFTIQFQSPAKEAGHYAFANKNGEVHDSHRTTIQGPKAVPGGSDYIENRASTHLFLRRVSK